MSGYNVKSWRYPFYDLRIEPGTIYQRHWDMVDGDLGRLINVTAVPGTWDLYGRWSIFTQYSLGKEKVPVPPGSWNYKSHLYCDFRNSGGLLLREFVVYLWHTEDVIAPSGAPAHAPALERTAVEHDAEGNIQWACLFAEGSPVPSPAAPDRYVTYGDTPPAFLSEEGPGSTQEKERSYLADLVDNHRIDPAKASFIRK